MERLRAAIEQARQSREDSQVARGARAADAKAADVAENETSSTIDERWLAIKEFELKPRRMRKNRLCYDEASNDRVPFDMLRTRLLAQCKKEGWKRVAITSPSPSCGKSTTCGNLALSMARQSDLRTLVIEGDMRRPSLAKMFGIQGDKSFFDVLKGEAEFSDQAVRIGKNVAMTVNFSAARGSGELLHRKQTEAFLKLIEDAYQPDIVLFDMPPMMSGDETLGFLQYVDCALLIARAETTTFDEIDFCETELAAHTSVAGVVLNRCRYSGSAYGYHYGEY